ncbi:MAG: HTTM domain-containing protein [Bdellovibrionales bacterium]
MRFNALDRFFFAPTDSAALSRYRVFLGLLIFFHYLAHFPHWDAFYGPNGFSQNHGYFLLFRWLDPLPPQILWWVGLLAALAVAIGWETWIGILVLFLLQTARNQTNFAVVNGEDLVLRMLLFWSLFLRLDGHWSLKNSILPWPRLGGGLWALRAAQVCVASIYFFSLPKKLAADPAWLDGSIMYYVFANTTWSRVDLPALTTFQPIYSILTYFTIVIEGVFPLLVWWERFRLPLTLFMLSLHFGIAFLLANVTFFSLAMVAGLMLFLKSEDLLWLSRFKPYQIEN